VVFGIAMSAKVIYFLARGGSKSEPRGIEIDTPEREV
jgi:hypothetical protein